jgi:hypothetical protein
MHDLRHHRLGVDGRLRAARLHHRLLAGICVVLSGWRSSERCSVRIRVTEFNRQEEGMRNPQGTPTIASTLTDPIINGEKPTVGDVIRHKRQAAESATILVGLIPVPRRAVEDVIRDTLDILIEEITPGVLSGRLEGPEHVLGVLLKVREAYGPQA